MATEIERLVLALSADVRGMEKALDRAAGKTRDSANKIERRFDQMNKRVSRSGLDMANELKRGIAAIGLGLAIRETVEYADAWTTARNRLAAAGVALQDVAAVQDRLVRLSLDTRTGLTETVDLYSRLTRATRDLGTSQDDIFRATTILNQAFKAGGAAASEQRAAILQLGQALGSGVLQGDELRSIRENAPLLAKAIADEFDTTVAGLKELGAQGELTTDRLFAGILAAGEEIQSQFGVTDATISDSIANLQTALTRLIGNVDSRLGASEGVRSFFRGLERLATISADLIPVDPTSGLEDRIFQELQKSVVVVGEYTTATRAAAEAEKGLTKEQVEARREAQRTGEFQKDQQIERLQGLREELALVIQLQQVRVRQLDALSPVGKPTKDLEIARGSLENMVLTDEALGRQIASAIAKPAAAYVEAAEDLEDANRKVGASFKDARFRQYSTDLEDLNGTIREIVGGYEDLATAVTNARAASDRAAARDDGSDDALKRIRSTQQAAADLESKLADFGASRGLVQAVIDYARATQDIVGAIAELDRLSGVIAKNDFGIAMRELEGIAEDLTNQVLVGEDRILAEFESNLERIQSARAAAAAVGIDDLARFDRAVDELYQERADALFAIQKELNPSLKDVIGFDGDVSGLSEIIDVQEYEAIGENMRRVLRQSVKDAFREGIQTDDWGTAFRGILADAVVEAFDDALDQLGDFLANLFLGGNGQSGLFGAVAAGFTRGGGRASGGATLPRHAYPVNETGRGEFLFMGNNPGQVLTASQINGLTRGGSGGGATAIDNRIIIQGDLTESTLAKVEVMQQRRDAELMRRMPGVIDGRVNDSIVNRRLRSR